MDIANYIARNRDMLLGVAGLVTLAALAVGGFLYYQAQREIAPPQAQPIVVAPAAEVAPAVQEEEPVQALFATRNISPGEFLDRTSMEWQDIPRRDTTGDHLTRTETGIVSYIGAAVREPIQSGTPIYLGAVVRTNQSGYLAAILRPNYRAVTVPLSYQNSMAGFLNPGDFVNVTVTANRNNQETSKTFLRNVRIIAIDQRVAGAIGGGTVTEQPQTATLELKQTDVEKLSVARQGGQIAFSLLPLSGWDKDLLESSADMDKVFRSPDAEVKVAVTLHRGESQVTEEFWVE